MERIPLAGPWITDREIGYVTDAVTNAWGVNANMYHDRFETAFAAYLGRSYAIALPSCTSAIHLALLALEIGPGDEVIVPDCTWIASAAPVTYVGATPVFVDIDPLTWCICENAFERAITSRTKAVIVVDLYGSMPRMEAILRIASAHKIAVVEDAAEAIGSSYDGRLAGSFGDAGVFSFHGSKTLTTGEGGMLVTDRLDLYERVLFLRDHGRRVGDVHFFNSEIAYKYKMSNMQAALGLAQTERIAELIQRKREVFDWYRDAFAGDSGILLNAEPTATRNSYWMVTAVWEKTFERDKMDVAARMREAGVDARPFFHPLSSLPAYRDFPGVMQAQVSNVVSYDVGARGVNLPSAFSLRRDDIVRVRDVLIRTLIERVVTAPSPRTIPVARGNRVIAGLGT